MSAPKCRLCGSDLTQTFVDLGMSPPCESYLEADELDRGEDVLPAPRADLLVVPARPAAGVPRG